MTMAKRDDRRDPILDRFLARVRFTNGCWIWIGRRTGSCNNYGVITFQGNHVLAHRMSWILKNGPIPDGINICHKCDNGLCVRPDHLFPGTQLDNMRDCIAKGRDRKAVGERQGHSKLTEKQVFKIRKLLSLGRFSQRQIGKMFNVTKTAIGFINTRTNWRHI